MKITIEQQKALLTIQSPHFNAAGLESDSVSVVIR